MEEFTQTQAEDLIQREEYELARRFKNGFIRFFMVDDITDLLENYDELFQQPAEISYVQLLPHLSKFVNGKWVPKNNAREYLQDIVDTFRFNAVQSDKSPTLRYVFLDDLTLDINPVQHLFNGCSFYKKLLLSDSLGSSIESLFAYSFEKKEAQEQYDAIAAKGFPVNNVCVRAQALPLAYKDCQNRIRVGAPLLLINALEKFDDDTDDFSRYSLPKPVIEDCC